MTTTQKIIGKHVLVLISKQYSNCDLFKQLQIVNEVKNSDFDNHVFVNTYFNISYEAKNDYNTTIVLDEIFYDLDNAINFFNSLK